MAIIDSATFVETHHTGGLANTNTNTNTTTSTSNDTSTSNSSSKSMVATTSVSTTNSISDPLVATTQANATIQAAQTQAGAQERSAQAQSQADIQVSQNNANATTEAATTRAEADKAAAESAANATTQAATTRAGADVSVATAQSQATIRAAQFGYQGDQAKANADVQVAQIREAGESSRLTRKLAFANEKFDAILPLIAGLATGGAASGSSGGIGFQASAGAGGMTMSSGGDFTAMGTGEIGYYSRRSLGFAAPDSFRMGGGDVKVGGIGFAAGGSTVADAVAQTSLPFISTRGVLSPAQVQQSVNAAVAQSDSRTQAEVRRLVSEMTGRGFSPSSPVLAALRVGMVGQGLRANLEASTQIRIEAAKNNVEATFRGQKAVADQFAQQESILVDHEKNEVSREVGILGAVAQMVAGAL